MKGSFPGSFQRNIFKGGCDMIMTVLSAIENEEQRSKAERIYKKYGVFMLRVASKYLSEDRAEDALQEAMLRIIGSLDKIDEKDDLRCRSFCGSVTKHTAIDMLRSEKSHADLDEASDLTNDVSAEDTALIRYDAELAVKAILSLNDTYRNVCYLKYVNALKEREIAEILGLSEKVVSLRIFRGKQIIRKALEETNE